MPNLESKRESALSAVRFSSLTMQRWITAMQQDGYDKSCTDPVILGKVVSLLGLADELEETILSLGSRTS